MNVPKLVGAVSAAVLREQLQPDQSGTQSTGRFVLNLNPEQVAAVAHAVIADPFLNGKIDLKLPKSYVGDFGLPEDALTTWPTTYYRNASCAKTAYLLAEVEHDEQASLNELTRLGPPELLERLDLWVREVADGLGVAPEQFRWWEKCLTGLRDLRLVSLDRFAAYLLRTREAISDDGMPLLRALGAALPALHLPRDSFYFNGIKERARGHASAWRSLFTAAHKKRGGLLQKQTAGQLLLSEEGLRAAFEQVENVIPEIRHAIVQAFITSPSGWNPEAAALAECEWEEIKPLFDGLQRERYNLGQSTLDFYDENDPTIISDEDRDYLRLLISRRTTESTDEDLAFYDAHRTELKEDRRLKSAWDRFVFGRPIESADFLAGLCAAMEPLFNRMPAGSERKLRIRCESATRRELRNLNVEAGLYFAHRYAGLRRQFGAQVAWEVGELFTFRALVEGWRANTRAKLNTSTAKPALQLKFLLELETKTPTGATQTSSSQLIWRYEPASVTTEFVDDWTRLARNPFVACRTSREFAGNKSIDLRNVKTFMPAYDRDRGSVVPVYRREKDLAIAWRSNLRACMANGYISSESAARLDAVFAAFENAYTKALREFPENGGGAPANFHQFTTYAALLDSVVNLAKGDRNREQLLKPLLEIGVVQIDGGPATAVVAPWHPMRLAAIWRRTRLAADLINQILRMREPEGDTKLFFRDLDHDFCHALYPELVAIWTTDGPQLLAVSDVVSDYSLHEPPVAIQDGANETSESPSEGSACVLDLMRRYLALHPHERANMSVVLFNCDSARLPQAVVEKIGTIQDDDEDVRCQVLLRHIDSERLRDVYRSILTADTDADAYSASEATQDFMARLRISVIADQAPPPDPKDGCPYDIVFSQDVISRHAQVEWYFERAEPADFASLLPSRWSRRRPAARDDLKSAVYLCCPVQSAEGWSYLTALATVFRGDWDGNASKRLLPVRQLDFRDGRTARIFQETHDLGNWVVNFDELLDRRQLLNQEVRVIRYKQLATQGRNLIISSRAPLTLLRSMILHRLHYLGLELDDADIRRLAERLIEDANDMSGDIVLRAATRGQSASELIGLVLSRRLLRDELGADSLFGWYFLDDYAAWIGQREQQLADLLAIKPHVADTDLLRVTLAVSEAKYVDLASLANKRKESQKQLRETVLRLEDAVFGDPERLDRRSWLARLADLMLDGIQIQAASGIDLNEWRRAMREGRCEIELRGASHVFVPTASDGAEPTDATAIAGVQGAYQEVFGRAALRQLLMAYWRNENTADLRRSLGFDHLDVEPTWRRPGSGAPPSSVNARRTVPRPAPPVTPPPPPHAPAEPTTASAAATPVEAEPPTETPIVQPPSPEPRWAYPGVLQLLANAPQSDETSSAQHEWLAHTATATKTALQQLQLQARLLDSGLTPNSALLRFAGNANLTVDQVLRKRSELLTTFGLNVISVRPEPGAVVVAIERHPRQTVDIRSLWSTWRPATGGWGNQELLIGVKESTGALLFLSPGKDHAPHTLIAGSTGSGKSVLMQNIILAIAATNTLEQARIILIDPKQGVDYFAFESLPHLDGGVIDSQEIASRRLAELVTEMDRRYVRFKDTRVANLDAFNAKVASQERLPVIWLIHDEFAEWMLIEDYKEAVSATVQRLGVKARAAGIYLVFAAQRPDANVMPMQLRANLGNRLILRVDSEGTSEIALGEKGAERLLGRGHLLAKLEGERELIFAQVPLVDPEFANALVAVTIARSQAA